MDEEVQVDVTPSVSPVFSANARKAEVQILQRLASVGQRAVAQALGVHESTISRMKSDGDFAQFARIVAALDLQVVPNDHQVFDPQKLHALMTLADDGLRSLRASVKGRPE